MLPIMKIHLEWTRIYKQFDSMTTFLTDNLDMCNLVMIWRMTGHNIIYELLICVCHSALVSFTQTVNFETLAPKCFIMLAIRPNTWFLHFVPDGIP